MEQVGHPGIVLECPSNYGTRDTQTQGLCGASRTWTVLECPSNYGTCTWDTQTQGYI